MKEKNCKKIVVNKEKTQSERIKDIKLIQRKGHVIFYNIILFYININTKEDINKAPKIIFLFI